MALLQKAGVIFLICLLIVMIIGQTTRDTGVSPIAKLFILIGTLVALFYSVRWLLILSGRKYRVGSQAFAILWCIESILGVLLGLALFRGVGVLTGLAVILFWSASFWLTYRWLSKLRKQELVFTGKVW